jgi:hypothetical protein
MATSLLQLRHCVIRERRLVAVPRVQNALSFHISSFNGSRICCSSFYGSRFTVQAFTVHAFTVQAFTVQALLLELLRFKLLLLEILRFELNVRDSERLASLRRGQHSFCTPALNSVRFCRRLYGSVDKAIGAKIQLEVMHTESRPSSYSQTVKLPSRS